jgi:Tfp pilus assembly protein PilN
MVELWGARRELGALRAQREALRPAVADAMAIRDSLGTVRGALETLASLEATAPHWSGFLTDVADYLPSGAHLLALRAAGDSAVLQGVAREAAGAFEAIRQIPDVSGVRAEAPIRQEIAADGTPREYFALGTKVRP